MSHDIKNSVHHVFSQHEHCSDCCKANTEPSPAVQTDNQICTSSCQSTIDESSLLDDQIDIWNAGSSISSQEEARYGTSIEYKNVEQHIIKDVTKLLCRISEKADRLINDSTTNLTESWMHIRTTFDGGKVHSLCNCGSWHARCYGGAL